MNDLAYQLFREIEIDLQDKPVNQLQPMSAPGNTKQEMIASALLNDNVQFYWIMLSTDIQDEQLSQDLLREIIELWLTIRGFLLHVNGWKCTKGIRPKLPRKANR